MRVLLSPVAVFGHLYPLLPLARAFRGRGDEVAIVGPPSIAQMVAGEDFEVLSAGPEIPELLGEVIRRTGVNPVAAGSAPDADVEAEVFAGARVDLSYDDTLSVAREWRPDLVVGDSYDYLGPMVAAKLLVPFGTVTLGQDHRPDQTAALRSKAAPRYEERGLSLRQPSFVADICPSALQVDTWQKPEGWLPMRPETHHAPNDPAPKPSSSPLIGERPRVLITFGTLFSDPRLVSPVINAVAALEVDLRVTLGPVATPEEFDVDHDRIQFERFRPLAELMSDVDVLVSHAGAGSTISALSVGVPVVAVPQAADQFAVAERIVASNTGLRLLPGEEAGESGVRQAVSEVLANPAFRANAAKIAAQIGDMPTAVEVSESIARLLG